MKKAKAKAKEAEDLQQQVMVHSVQVKEEVKGMLPAVVTVDKEDVKEVVSDSSGSSTDLHDLGQPLRHKKRHSDAFVMLTRP